MNIPPFAPSEDEINELMSSRRICYSYAVQVLAKEYKEQYNLPEDYKVRKANSSYIYTPDEVIAYCNEHNVDKETAKIRLRRAYYKNNPPRTKKQPSKYATEDEIEVIMHKRQCSRHLALMYVRSQKIKEPKQQEIEIKNYILLKKTETGWVQIEVTDDILINS